MRDVLDSDALEVAATPLRIALVLLLAFVLRAVAHRAVNRLVRQAGTGVPLVLRPLKERVRDNGGEPTALLAERRRQRAETLGSVLRSTVSCVLYGIAGAMVLSELGLDLGPVLASAGIVGVALGFGAQNLVRDVLNGMFMILEDQYGVGDVVDVGAAVGTVEAVALRTTRLRASDGTVWHVRNGEILRVGNTSQGWARAVLDVPVQWDSDLAAVRDLLHEVATSMAAEDEWSHVVLEAPEVTGVESLAADQLVLRVAMRTSPEDKERVVRELRARLKAAFDAAPARTGGPRGPRPARRRT